MKDGKINDQQRKELLLAAEKAEEHVRKKNIFYRKTLDELIGYEAKISRIAFETGLQVERVVSDAGIRSPIDILNDAITDWGRKLQRGRMGSEKELIDRLKNDFQVDVRRTMKEIIPTDVLEEKGEGNEKGVPAPDDMNRVEVALRLLLSLQVHDENIRLDDMEIIVGVPPKNSWRKRPYWIIDLIKLKIAVFLNNQSTNRTFVASYGTKKELDAMMEWTKKKFKEEKSKGSQIEHFVYNDEAQFEEDLRKALKNVIEKTVPAPMNEKYFLDKSKVHADLQGFVDGVNQKKKRKKIGIEEVEPDHVRLIPHKCSNGEVIAGSTWLNRAGVVFKMAETRREAQKKQKEIMEKLLVIAGIPRRERPGIMDEKYFQDAGNVHKDLEAFLEAVKKAKVRAGKKPPAELSGLSTDAVGKVEAVCANGEKVNGITYILRGGKSLGLAKGVMEGRKKMKKILNEIKKTAGLEVIAWPDMDENYFSEENIRADLEKFAVKAGVAVEEINTVSFDGTSATCNNGETIEGKTYLARAAKAIYPKVTTSPEASKLMGKTLNDLKKRIGMRVTEYPEMDEEYFNPVNIAKDLEAVRMEIVSSGKKKNRIPRTVRDLTTYDFKRINFVCVNGEKISGSSYLNRAAKALKMVSRSKGKNKCSHGQVIEALLKKITSHSGASVSGNP